jgi:cytidylate kinase
MTAPHSRRRPIVAIDGPAGSGKSTAARLVAEALGYTYIDTGAMYRAVALACLRAGVDLDDAEGAARVAASLSLAFRREEGHEPRLFAGEEDVSTEIRRPEIGEGASRVSVHQAVRELLVSQQRAMGRAGGIVMEGRDIQTHVFPDAEVKVFLTASPEERARRRAAQLAEKGLPCPPYGEILEAIRVRDARDSGREAAPLAAATDAEILVTDGLGIDEVVARLVALARREEESATP